METHKKTGQHQKLKWHVIKIGDNSKTEKLGQF